MRSCMFCLDFYNRSVGNANITHSFFLNLSLTRDFQSVNMFPEASITSGTLVDNGNDTRWCRYTDNRILYINC